MIGLISHAGSFERLGHYLEHGLTGGSEGRVAWTEPRNLLASDIKEVAAEMKDLAALSDRVEKPAYHLSVSFDPADPVDKRKMVQVADRLLHDLGLSEQQALIVAHRDAYYPHFHVMANRVHPLTGKATEIGFPYYRIEKSLRHQERALGFAETPGRHYRLPDQEFAPVESWRQMDAELRRWVRGALYRASSWRGLEESLREQGLSLKVDRNALWVTDGKRAVHTGALARGASLAKMEQRFGQAYDAYRLRQRSHGTEREATVPPDAGGRRAQSIAQGEITTSQGAIMDDENVYGPNGVDGAQSEGTAGSGPRGPDQIDQGDASTGQHEALSPAVQEILTVLQTHSEIVALTQERSELIGQLNALEMDVADHLDQLEEVRGLSAELDALFARIYREPAAARTAFDAHAVLEGGEVAASALRKTPERFGTLRGREVGWARGTERADAERAVGPAAEKARALHDAAHRGAVHGNEGERRTGDLREAGHARDEKRDVEPLGEVRPRGQDEALLEALGNVYVAPDRAREALARVSEEIGLEKAQLALQQAPELFGTLHPGGRAHLPQVSAEMAQVRTLGPAAGHGDPVLNRIEAQVEKARTRARAANRRIAAINARLAELPGRAELEKSIQRKISGFGARDQAALTRVVRASPTLGRVTTHIALYGAQRSATAFTREATGRDMSH